MITQQLFIDEIYTLITSSVSNINVYDTIAAPNADMPYIVFSIIADTPKLIFEGDVTDIEIQINVYDEVNSGVSVVRAYSDQIVQTLEAGFIEVSGRTFNFDVIEKGVSEISEDQSIVSIRTGFRIR